MQTEVRWSPLVIPLVVGGAAVLVSAVIAALVMLVGRPDWLVINAYLMLIAGIANWIATASVWARSDAGEQGRESIGAWMFGAFVGLFVGALTAGGVLAAALITAHAMGLGDALAKTPG